MIKNVIIAGVGGQGTIFAGKILGTMAYQTGLHVKISEIHGMSQRGGSVVTQVRFGKHVYAPLAQAGEVDVLIALEELEALRGSAKGQGGLAAAYGEQGRAYYELLMQAKTGTDQTIMELASELENFLIQRVGRHSR